jgi:hypothetical protein
VRILRRNGLTPARKGARLALLAVVIGTGIALLGGPLGKRAAAQTSSPHSRGVALSILDRLGPSTGPADTSVAIGDDGRPLISYYDGENGDLKIARCRTVKCKRAQISVVDSASDVGRWNSLTVGADGLGLVSYFDATNGAVKIAHCRNAACSSATTAILDVVGGPSSIAVGVDGLGLIAYAAAGTLKVAHCADLACSAASISILDLVEGDPHPSITIGADGRGLISYANRAEDNPRLDVAHCSDVACSTATVSTPAPLFLERVTSITTGSDGLGLISFADIDSNAGVVHCTDVVCSTATTAFLGVDFVRANSITVGADGYGLVSSVRGDALGLNVAHCQDVGCGSATSTSVDPSPSAEGNTSIEVGVDGRPIISYYEDSDLAVARCDNPTCQPR